MGVTAGWAQAEGNQRKWNDNAAEYIINLESAYNFPPELIRGGGGVQGRSWVGVGLLRVEIMHAGFSLVWGSGVGSAR